MPSASEFGDEIDRGVASYERWSIWSLCWLWGMVKTQFRIKSLKRFQIDHGGKYLSHRFNNHLATNGIKWILTTHDTPADNRVAEWLNQVLLECTQAFLHSSMLPRFLWREAVKYAIWLKNRMATCTLPESKTPYKMLYSKNPNLEGLREWGMKVWVHDVSGTNLDDRSRIGQLVGFKEASNAHWIFWLDNHSVTVKQILNSTIMMF